MVATNKPHILFLGTQMEVAGAQRVLLSQARWFREKGYTVWAAFLYDKQHLLKQWQASNPFPIFSLGGRKLGSDPVSNGIRLIGAVFKLYGLLKNGPEIIISFTPHSNLIGLPVAWLARVPVRIGTVHGQIAGLSNLFTWLHGRLANSKICSMMVCVSEQVKEHVSKREHVNLDRLTVIENGIDLKLFDSFSADRRVQVREGLNLPRDGILFIAVGRLTLEKGHMYLLDAISQIAPRYPTLRLVVVGDGPLSARLEIHAQNKHISEKLILVGLRNDVIDLLMSSDIYVQPSLSEGLSLALLEALGARLPIVATKIPAFTTVVKDEESALLVPPANAEKLAIALERLICDDGLRRRIAESGRELVKKRYSLATMCQSYESLILELTRDVT